MSYLTHKYAYSLVKEYAFLQSQDRIPHCMKNDEESWIYAISAIVYLSFFKLGKPRALREVCAVTRAQVSIIEYVAPWLELRIPNLPSVEVDVIESYVRRLSAKLNLPESFIAQIVQLSKVATEELLRGKDGLVVCAACIHYVCCTKHTELKLTSLTELSGMVHSAKRTIKRFSDQIGEHDQAAQQDNSQ